ncbi:MAG: threonine synthase [Thermoplasmatota archaeon]
MKTASALVDLKCPACGRAAAAERPVNHCTCGSPYLAHYDLASVTRSEVFDAPGPGLWRFRRLLPIRDTANIVTIGEGATPLLEMPRLAREIGVAALAVKEEGGNPTGTFKARGLALAVSKAKELGLTRLAVPTAGNAGVALAAYAARAGITAAVYVPRDAPLANRVTPRLLGAEVTEVEGNIADAAAQMREHEATLKGFDVSTLREPYRLEGKKTLGFELFESFESFENFEGRLPNVVLYPTGGGTGLLGMWKAWDELEAIGVLGRERPRLVAVQSEGCAPVVRAWKSGADHCEPWANASTIAAGLRVPKPFADKLILRALRETKGDAVAVSDDELVAGVKDFAREGIVACPEGGATVAALRAMVSDGRISRDERVCVYNTGSGALYPDVLERATRA